MKARTRRPDPADGGAVPIMFHPEGEPEGENYGI